MSSGNVSKYEFSTGEDAFTEKDLIEKAATTKRFEYSSLGTAFERQADVIER